jgi:hypothetical protein
MSEIGANLVLMKNPSFDVEGIKIYSRSQVTLMSRYVLIKKPHRLFLDLPLRMHSAGFLGLLLQGSHRTCPEFVQDPDHVTGI